MNWKKFFQISDHFPYFSFPKNKVVSKYTLGIVSFFIFLCVLFFNVSFTNPISYNSVISWSLSFTKTPSINATFVENPSNGNFLEFGDEGHFGNFTQDIKNGSYNEKESIFKGTHLSNFTNDVKNGSFNEKSYDLGDDGHFRNCTQGTKNGCFDGKDSILKGTHLSNFTNDVKNGSFNEKSVDLGDDGRFSNFTQSTKNGSYDEKDSVLKSTHLSNFTNDVKNLTLESDFDSKKGDGVLIVKTYSSSYEECDIFNGRWVRDDTKPYYKAGSCPYIDRDFDCHLNKRPDDGYVKWKWQPFRCDIPSLNATDFLERLRGKKLVFVGDSLNRNMWESLVCILRDSVKNKNRVYEISGRHEFKKKGFYAFRFEDYNCTVDFVSSVFLVQESSLKRKNGSVDTLRLDLMDPTTSMYHDADVLVFNTGHWWTHEKTSRGENYYQEGDHVYPRLKVLDAYRRALSTWARWVDTNIDTNKTQVIYRGYSVTHFKGGQWNSGGKCHKETEPIFNTSHLTKYPSKMRAFDNILRAMKTPIIYLNISRLTDYRKDGHPSIYRMEYKSVEEQIAAEQSQDCSHWCLPGVPDTWNELLYASLLKVGKGSWKI